MARSFAVALLVGLVVLGFSTGGPTAFIDTPSCQPTPVQDLLPDVVAPLVGSSPAWLVDGSATWTSATEAVKTLWVLKRSSEPVSISGHRLDAPGFLKLRRGDDPPTTELVVANPARESAIPGGARTEIMRAYAFLPSHVFYPSPGCWEFRVHQAGYDVHIVRELKPVVPIGGLHGFLIPATTGPQPTPTGIDHDATRLKSEYWAYSEANRALNSPTKPVSLPAGRSAREPTFMEFEAPPPNNQLEPTAHDAWSENEVCEPPRLNWKRYAD